MPTFAMPVLLDIAVAAVLILFAFLGYRRGFLMTVSGLLSVLIAIFGARAVSGALTAPISQRFVRPAVQSVAEELGGILCEPADSLELGDLEAAVSDLLSVLNLPSSGELGRQLTGSVQSATERACDTIADNLTSMAVFLLAFVVIQILAILAIRALNAVLSLPIIGLPNRVLGLLAGGLKGAAIIALVMWAAMLFFPSLSGGILAPSVLSQTNLAHHFAYFISGMLT